jgi:hypothetical protein
MPPRASQEIIDLLAAEQCELDNSYTAPGERGEKGAEIEDWYPSLSPTGRVLFDCMTKFMLAHGERGSGKTFACLHKLVRHCYDNDNASACITTLTRSQAILGGPWTKLQKVLAEWREGLGLEGEGPDGEFLFKMDDARNRYVWIKNVHGGWSMIFLKSLLHADQVSDRIKAMEFTFYFYDELTDTPIDAEEYFTGPIQQLGRISGVHPQQYLGACNPPEQGEDHWVHKRFFVGFDDPAAVVPKRKVDYAVMHFPMSENTFIENKEDFIRNVLEACRNDPTAYDRLILGKWTKRPTGKGLFSAYFREQLHVKGDRRRKVFVIPKRDVVDVGIDLGPRSTGIAFLQRVQTLTGETWIQFDELPLIDKYVALPEVALMVLSLMDSWCRMTARPLHFNFISDAAAFDQQRQDGTYDAKQLQDIMTKELKEHPEKFPNLRHFYQEEKDDMGNPTGKLLLRRRIKLAACPKPPGSRPGRVKMMIARLIQNLFFVSARCEHSVEMFKNLDEQEGKPFVPSETSRHRHIFDAISYVIFFYEMGGRLPPPPSDSDRSSDLLDINL